VSKSVLCEWGVAITHLSDPDICRRPTDPDVGYVVFLDRGPDPVRIELCARHVEFLHGPESGDYVLPKVNWVGEAQPANAKIGDTWDGQVLTSVGWVTEQTVTEQTRMWAEPEPDGGYFIPLRPTTPETVAVDRRHFLRIMRLSGFLIGIALALLLFGDWPFNAAGLFFFLLGLVFIIRRVSINYERGRWPFDDWT